MFAQIDPRRSTDVAAEMKYYYRRNLNARELLPAVGAAIGAGVVVFYLMKLFLERTPLRLDPSDAGTSRTLYHWSSSAAASHAGRR